MKTTTNLGLKKIELTDSPPDITVQDTNWDSIDKHLNTAVKYQKASGTGTAITLSEVTLEDGYQKTFIVTANNSSAATKINGKNLYKPGGTAAPNLISGKAVTVWYDLAGDCFFIKASAEGDAIAANVLAGKKFSNDDDTGIAGAMVNNGAVNQSLPVNGNYTIPQGYHDGTGKVTQALTTKGAATITPGTTNQTIAANQYLTGVQTILGEADLVAGNIKKGIDIFGKVGTYEGASDITGTLKASVKYTEPINKGDLVITKRHFGYDTPISLAQPSTLPTNSGYSCAWSNNGIYLAIGHNNSPYLTIYKRTGDTLNKLTNPVTLPAGLVTGVSFSSDNVYLAVVTAANTTCYIYKRSGDSFTLITSITGAGGTALNCVAFSNDTNYLAIGSVTAQYLTVHSRNGDTFTFLSGVTYPTGEVKGLSWSTDGNYLAVAMTANPFIRVYKRSGNTFTVLPTPGNIPNSSTTSCAFSNNGNYLVVTYQTSPYIIIYKRSGDSFVAISNISVLPSALTNSCAWSPDDTYLTIGLNSGTTPFLIYKRNADVFTKLADPSIFPSSSARAIAYNPSNAYFSVALALSPYIMTYKGDLLGDYAYKYNSSNFNQDFNYSNYINFGYATETALASETEHEIVTIPIK